MFVEYISVYLEYLRIYNNLKIFEFVRIENMTTKTIVKLVKNSYDILITMQCFYFRIQIWIVMRHQSNICFAFFFRLFENRYIFRFCFFRFHFMITSLLKSKYNQLKIDCNNWFRFWWFRIQWNRIVFFYTQNRAKVHSTNIRECWCRSNIFKKNRSTTKIWTR